MSDEVYNIIGVLNDKYGVLDPNGILAGVHEFYDRVYETAKDYLGEFKTYILFEDVYNDHVIGVNFSGDTTTIIVLKSTGYDVEFIGFISISKGCMHVYVPDEESEDFYVSDGNGYRCRLLQKEKMIPDIESAIEGAIDKIIEDQEYKDEITSASEIILRSRYAELRIYGDSDYAILYDKNKNKAYIVTINHENLVLESKSHLKVYVHGVGNYDFSLNDVTWDFVNKCIIDNSRL